MPGFNGTGPMGAGPMTGGARGYCNRRETGYAGSWFKPAGWYGMQGYGRGMRRGLGRGRGFRRYGTRGFGLNTPVYSMTKEEELHFLKQEADSIKATLDQINQRISEIDT